MVKIPGISLTFKNHYCSIIFFAVFHQNRKTTGSRYKKIRGTPKSVPENPKNFQPAAGLQRNGKYALRLSMIFSIIALRGIAAIILGKEIGLHSGA